jgi:4Fe-4S ferredoxin
MRNSRACPRNTELANYLERNMKRGTTIKRSNHDNVVLERKMITRTHLLTLDREKCVGCELCTAVCPQEAIEYVPGKVEEGKLVERPTVDIDPEKCNFCGECVVICPVNALSLLVDGEPSLQILELEAFPTLTKEITVDASKVPPKMAEACEASCPTEVITVEIRRSKTGRISKVLGVAVDESDCIYCKQCEAACPGAFKVTHPFEGIIRLEASLCPAGCQACADVCPTDALVTSDGKLNLDERFCLYCGACTQVCPVPEALVVKRHRVRHSPIKSGAWIDALAKLISTEMAAEELAIKSQAKRRTVSAFLPGVPRKE